MKKHQEPTGLSQSVSAAIHGEEVSAQGIFAAVGGARGILETTLPGLLYLILFIITSSPAVSVIAPSVLAVVFVVWRLVARQSTITAFSGTIGVAVCVVTTLLTGRGEDYFLPGFWINGAWVVALTLSLLVGWPLMGFIAGTLQGDVTGWRKDRHIRRTATVATLIWCAMFVARLAVQMPLYFAENVAALGVARLVMGTPLFALVILCTWLLFRHVNRDSEQESQ